MRRIIIIKILLSFSIYSNYLTAQNLIKNGSFENAIICPDYHGQINRCLYWTGWHSTTTDYYLNCNDINALHSSVPNNWINGGDAKSGKAYAGISLHRSDTTIVNDMNDWNEYLITKLDNPLIIGRVYIFSMFLKLPGKATFTSDEFGALFTTQNTFYNNKNQGYIEANPQLKNNKGNFVLNQSEWVEFQQTFIADSAYQYLTIGNFRNRFKNKSQQIAPKNTNDIYHLNDPYILIDNVSLYPQLSICKGDSILLKSEFPVNWSTNHHPNYIFSTDTALYVKPTQNTIYLANGSLDTIKHFIQVLDLENFSLGNDTNLCEGHTLMLQIPIEGANYIWHDNSKNYFYEVIKAEKIKIKIATNCGILADSLLIKFNKIPINLGNDTLICENETYILDCQYTNATYIWNNGNSTSTQYLNPSNGFLNQYWIKVITQEACGIDTILIKLAPPLPKNYLKSDTLFCENDSIFLEYKNPIVNEYEWTNFSKQNSIWVNSEGQFVLKISNKCFIESDTILVKKHHKMAYSFVSDTLICDRPILLNINTDKENIVKWKNQNTGTSKVIYQPDIYLFSISDKNCSYKDSVVVKKDKCNTHDIEIQSIIHLNFQSNLTFKVSSCENFIFKIIDMNGKLHHQLYGNCHNAKQFVEINQLNAGLYLWQFEFNDGNLQKIESGKLMIIR